LPIANFSFVFHPMSTYLSPMRIILSCLILFSCQQIGFGQAFKPSKKQAQGLEYLVQQELRAAEILVEIGGIISPSGQELERAHKVAEYMRQMGLQSVEVDENPNVIGVIPGKSTRKLVFIATLDDLETVADHQRKIGSKPVIEGNRVVGPGTNTSSITVAMLMAAEAILKANIQPEYTLVFAGVAQEETGLEGMKQVYQKYKSESVGFVDILGDSRSISYGAMGIHWYKVEAEGPAGHTLRGGLPNVNQALARAIDRIFSLDYPVKDKANRTVINISVIESGKVFNHKPETAWFSLDMRSLDAGVLAEMEKDVIDILKEVSAETDIQLQLIPYQITPGGQISGALNSGLVTRAQQISRFLGLDPNMSNAGSSNMNIAIAGGSNAIGLGGERGGQRGFPDEWADIDSMIRAAKHVFLLGTGSWKE
jgi:acetylornithine deacetylase/succinyl-diaminopimelate desuccinylase-like protein